MRYKVTMEMFVFATKEPQDEDFHIDITQSGADIGLEIEAEWWDIEEADE